MFWFWWRFYYHSWEAFERNQMGDHHHGRNGPEHSIIGSFERLIRDLSETDRPIIRSGCSDVGGWVVPGRDITERQMFLCKQHTMFHTLASYGHIWVSWILFTFCFWSRAAQGASPWCSSARCRCSSSSAGSRPAGPSAPSSSEKVARDEKGFFQERWRKKN